MTFLELATKAYEELGIRLEVVAGVALWEAPYTFRHQKAIARIRASFQPGSRCSCIHCADVAILFPDGSHKSPDISLFRREPDEEETEITLVPEAVIEVISKGYEA